MRLSSILLVATACLISASPSLGREPPDPRKYARFFQPLVGNWSVECISGEEVTKWTEQIRKGRSELALVGAVVSDRIAKDFLRFYDESTARWTCFIVGPKGVLIRDCKLDIQSHPILEKGSELQMKNVWLPYIGPANERMEEWSFTEVSADLIVYTVEIEAVDSPIQTVRYTRQPDTSWADAWGIVKPRDENGAVDGYVRFWRPFFGTWKYCEQFPYYSEKGNIRVQQGASGAAYIGKAKEDDDSGWGVEFTTSDFIGYYDSREKAWIHKAVELHTYDVPGDDSYTYTEAIRVDLDSSPQLKTGVQTRVLRTSARFDGRRWEQPVLRRYDNVDSDGICRTEYLSADGKNADNAGRQKHFTHVKECGGLRGVRSWGSAGSGLVFGFQSDELGVPQSA
jgi:hypothetical protein